MTTVKLRQEQRRRRTLGVKITEFFPLCLQILREPCGNAAVRILVLQQKVRKFPAPLLNFGNKVTLSEYHIPYGLCSMFLFLIESFCLCSTILFL